MILNNGKILIKDNILYFHGYIIVLSYIKSFSEIEKQELNETKIDRKFSDNELQDLFARMGYYDLYLELKNNIIQFNLFDYEKSLEFLEKTLNDTLQKIKILHNVSIILEDEMKKNIFDICLKNATFNCSAELKSLFHKVFVMPLMDLFLEMNIQENSVIVIKDLKDSKFRVEFI